MFRKGLPPPPPPLSSSSSSTAKVKVILVEKGTKVKYHPIFNEANLIPDLFKPVTVHLAPRRVEDGLADYTEFYKHDGSYWEDRYVDVEQLPCNKELATSPPCRRVYLNFGGGSLVENETGVTVDDAISAAVEIWDSEPDEETREEWEESSEERRRYYAREKQQHMVELEREIGSDLTWRDILGERNGWQGIKSALAYETDTVDLNPEWFAS